ncbi:LA2681 family HEPN domain-containing protein [Sphingorhabdus sp.]|uniref:LA2681 family HEPN domain-containing protein n=1 Tax=Sphingorhabdus sp. TaxID=1902408 RepID=UPI002FDAFCBE
MSDDNENTSDKPTITGLDNADALMVIGTLVDHAFDTENPKLIDHVMTLADELEARELSSEQLATLDYFRANGWDCRWQPRRNDSERVWDWEQVEVRQQVFLLRRALNSNAFDALPLRRRCEILTNLANQLDKLGRFVEAREYWTRAIVLDPNFWMARANRGHGATFYMRALYDPGHQGVFALHAHRDLIDAVDLIRKYPMLGDWRLQSTFADQAKGIADHVDLEWVKKAHKSDGWDMGESAAERAYRQWCLDNVLFLNPLNDIEQTSVAARDILSLPNFVTAIDEPPIVIGMANDLKQAFVSARWLLWEGRDGDAPHFSDRDVLLYNTLDYPCYGLSVEKVKIAYRLAYSTLDKIAYFLNHYLALGIPENRVGFRTVWRDKPKGPIRDRFAKSENWPWRGLFWLSKDLFEDDMRESTEPDARAVASLRNHLEHKYVKVLEWVSSEAPGYDPFYDTLAHTISRSDLERRTLRLMKLVRAALIYLFLGMHREERQRGVGESGLTAPMPLDPWRDEWKR